MDMASDVQQSSCSVVWLSPVCGGFVCNGCCPIDSNTDTISSALFAALTCLLFEECPDDSDIHRLQLCKSLVGDSVKG